MRSSLLVCAIILPVCQARTETVRLPATADIGVSSQIWKGESERTKSWGLSPRFKLKSIQEMGVIRFDASAAAGREVLSARLFLHRAGEDMLRYIRVSTVNNDWEEGTTREDYGPPSGACFDFADWETRRNWSWPGSCLADVIMSSGNSLHHWTECRKLEGGWISVDLPLYLVYALICGDTDGLAVQEGGNPAYFNNFVHSVQSGRFAPYIEVEMGPERTDMPAKPVFSARPAPERAHLDSGAVAVRIEPAANVFRWRIWLDGKQMERWRVKHPQPTGPTVIYFEDLEPSREYSVGVEAFAPWGAVSGRSELSVRASPALTAPPLLGVFRGPSAAVSECRATQLQRMYVWPLPGLVKVSPLESAVMFDDAMADFTEANAVWDGRTIGLFGARGEYVSFQLCIENPSGFPLEGVRVAPSPIEGPEDFRIAGSGIELYRNWYARNKDGSWQPAYCVPLSVGETLQIPDPERGIEGQKTQTVYVDIYIPKDAPAGSYRGSVSVTSEGPGEIILPVELEVLDFTLPDKLSFWPMMNVYSGFRPVHSFYRLAHQHRSMLYFRAWRPQLEGSGKDIKVAWDHYDEIVGPLLDGSAFKGSRRAGQPVAALLLPFNDSWPTPLSKETYDYQGYWPGKGDAPKHIIDHYMKAPYIGDALSRDYKDAFLSVQRQFIEHFKEKGWTGTEVHMAFVGKNTHRINYGSNLWWTTDEPYHWDDWLALQFFCRLWTEGRRDADPSRWMARADISRPQWQGGTLDGIIDTIYYSTGSINAPGGLRRIRRLEQETGLKAMAYGACNSDNSSNTGTVAWIISTWLNGMDGTLTWQGLGNDRALDVNDSAVGGNALLCPGGRFGIDVVGDMRLKAMRDAEQIVEYLVLAADRHGLNREQCRAMVRSSMNVSARAADGASADNAGALRFSTMKAWQLAELRRSLARLIIQ